MAWTKRELVNEAFGELALAGYTFDITPEETAAAIRRMDSMVATWEARGISIGYVLPTSPTGSDPDDDSGIPDTAAESVYLNLAVRLASSYGKQLSLDTRTAAREAFTPLLIAATTPGAQQLPADVPLGAGNKSHGGVYRVFTPDPEPDVFELNACGGLEIEP